MMANGKVHKVTVDILPIYPRADKELSVWCNGYIAASIKNVHDCEVEILLQLQRMVQQKLYLDIVKLFLWYSVVYTQLINKDYDTLKDALEN